jgi:hypothetical protein
MSAFLWYALHSLFTFAIFLALMIYPATLIILFSHRLRIAPTVRKTPSSAAGPANTEISLPHAL